MIGKQVKAETADTRVIGCLARSDKSTVVLDLGFGACTRLDQPLSPRDELGLVEVEVIGLTDRLHQPRGTLGRICWSVRRQVRRLNPFRVVSIGYAVVAVALVVARIDVIAAPIGASSVDRSGNSHPAVLDGQVCRANRCDVTQSL